MNLVYTKPYQKLAIAFNYLSLAALVALIYVAEAFGWSAMIGLGIGLAALAMLITLVRFHIRTGLWRMVHTSRKKLSEKQIPIIYRSVHRSYGLFAILSLVALLWKSLFPGPDPNLIIVFAALLYLAHTLPSAVIAWSEADVLLPAGIE